ncbi:MAG: membrane dipeptidase [Lachnospiraceae bacterium]|jgi:membrane dipeptidase|nr:membrane dipeptidase [Lachnospiraceae bacterium]NBJ82478.1 membrane dipeptidase [bacterium 1XD42-76]NBK05771.1 membrane dipeptidase [bacterium 1XD42-94]
MKAADMHCDTILEIYEKRQAGEACGILKNGLHIDLEKLKKGDYLLQNFAVFVHMKHMAERNQPLPEYAFMMIDTFFSEMRKYPELVGIARSYQDIEENWKNGRISALLTMEEGGICEGKAEYLRIFYELGVRMFTFTWNFPNELAWPNRLEQEGAPAAYFVPETEQGLTEKGFEFLEEMERLGMIADVSHLGDKGILDVIAHARRPFVASHSNARAVCRHSRNLTDEMIRGIAEKGGVIGINFYPDFLRNQEEQGSPMKVSVTDIARHIRHMIKTGGIECVGLGSDFDGITSSFEMKDASDLPILEESLRKNGFTEEEIEKIFYRNVLRVYKEIL